ncbi:MAG TPA: cytochrome c biogenesis protein CcmE, partial [Rhodanobacteraceae bacterium]|nr:cytochrome c biogenesis protein CcmE [Rhodanobacteraceae bacterium]
MNPVRKRRLIITLLILGAVAIAAGLSVFALQRNMTYLYSPS